MSDLQKAVVMGGVIGVCVLGGLLVIDRKDNTQPHTTVVQQSTSTAPTTVTSQAVAPVSVTPVTSLPTQE